MSVTRNQSARSIAAAFLPTERFAGETAALAARCYATIIEEQAEARLQPGECTEALQHVFEGQAHAHAAYEKFLAARVSLNAVRDRYQIPPSMFGPWCDSNSPRVPARAEQSRAAVGG